LVEEFTETIISVANLTIGKTKSKTPKPKVPKNQQPGGLHST